MACLLSERVPLGYDNHQSGRQCRTLAREFVQERNKAATVDADELDALCEEIVAWGRARGYHLMDEPTPPYMDCSRLVDRGEWWPKKSDQ